MKNLTIGVDIGGTNIKLGIINSQGKIISRGNLQTTKYAKSKNVLIKALISELDSLLEKNSLKATDILGIGIGLPGLVDYEKGNVIFLPNVPGWHNVPLKKIIESKIRIKTFLDNDVNLIALGEWKLGAGSNYENLICITLGTGVGGGLILDNKLYRGEGFAAGEIGHIPLNEKGKKCNCGGTACLEATIGRNALMQKAAILFKKRNIDLKEVYDLAEKGNARAIDFWRQTANHLGNGLVGIVNVLNPQLIVIGGGVSGSYKFLKPAFLKVLKERTMTVQSRMIKIAQAKLGDDAGIIGANVLVRESVS